MRVTGVTTNLPVADIDAARGFYTDYLGLDVEDFNLGWVARYTSPDGRACVQLVTRDATSPEDSVMSVHVGNDVDEAYAEAQRRGYEIVHPLTDEPWGIRRFFVRDPGRERDQHRQPPRRVSRLALLRLMTPAPITGPQSSNASDLPPDLEADDGVEREVEQPLAGTSSAAPSARSSHSARADVVAGVEQLAVRRRRGTPRRRTSPRPPSRR